MALEPTPLRELVPGLSDEVDRVVVRCLAKNPADRWQSASEVLLELKRIAAGIPAAGSWRRALARRPRLIAAAAAAGAVLAVAIGVVALRKPPPVAAPASVRVPSVQLAVLPLRMIGEVSDLDRHLGVGIADSIITRLAAVRQIGLRPTAAVLAYADPSADTVGAAKALAVGHLLVGTIQRNADTYRITLQLFERMTGEAAAARQLNPLGNVEIARLEMLGSLHSGAYQRAREQAATLLARSDAPVIRNYLGLAQFYTGDLAAARATLAAVKRSGRPDVRSQAALAGVEAAGDKAQAHARVAAIESGGYMDHHVAYSLGAAWAQIGNAGVSVKWLQQAADTGFPCFPWLIRDSLLDPIRRTPEFAALLSRLRQRYEEDAARYGGGPQ